MSRSDTRKYKRVLDPELAKLPGEMVTHDINDETKIHPHDAPHIRKWLAKKIIGKWLAEETQKNPITAASIYVGAHLNALRKHPERFKVINQPLVDVYRAMVIVTRAKRILKSKGLLPANLFKVCHIWFEGPDDGTMLRIKAGPAPRDEERPAFLKYLHLEVDMTDWPLAVFDMLLTGGVSPQGLQDAVKIKLAQSSVYTPAQPAGNEGPSA